MTDSPWAPGKAAPSAPGADESRARMLLHRLGVGPDAEAAAASAALPPAPQPTTPTRRGGNRMPDWWRGESVDFTVPPTADQATGTAPAATSEQTLAPVDGATEYDSEPAERPLDQEPAKPRRARKPLRPALPSAPPTLPPSAERPVEEDEPSDFPDGVRTTRIQLSRVRDWARPATDNHAARVIAFNAVAAGIGYWAGLVPFLERTLPFAAQAATGVAGLVLAAGGACAGWWVTGRPGVHQLLPFAPLSRTIVTVGAAELGRRLAPLPVTWLDQHGTAWGLGSASVSLLLATGGTSAGLYWLVDRRARHWQWIARLAVRIPLASALLATALYAPGPLH